MELDGGGGFTDNQTIVVWNRLTSVPSFTHAVNGSILTVTTAGFTLTYDARGDFSPEYLSVQLREPNFMGVTEWQPGQSTEGNLLGTMHTLDNIEGIFDLNCSYVMNEFHPYDEPEHCTMAVASQAGWALLDDSPSPIFGDDLWVHPRDSGQCAHRDNSSVACFPYEWNLNAQAACLNAGCCWAGGPDYYAEVALNGYYSQSRVDHFESPECAGCDNLYVFERLEGYGYQPGANMPPNTIPFYLWWNPQWQDNALMPFAPSDPNYQQVSITCYGYANDTDPSLLPPNAVPMQLWNHPNKPDYFSTATAAGEAEARNMGYVYLGVIGYVLSASSTPPVPPSEFKCYKPTYTIDWYLFTHGLKYADALKDLTAIVGRVNMPRRHMMGIAWSKWNESNTEPATLQQVESMASAGFPLDTYIFDMQWHQTPTWTGYSWDVTRYPFPEALLGWLHARGLATAANLHDAEGVMPTENEYKTMAELNGINPLSNQAVPFAISNETYASTLQSIVLQPVVDMGMDFWWTDWQQGMIGVLDVTGLNPTIWLNHNRYVKWQREGSNLRGAHLARYGGMGNLRYPVGFGGDVVQTWDSLNMMVYFTTTATNVGFCYWAQEIMQDRFTPELFTRVIQFGAFSPIYTNYGNGDEPDELWELPEPYQSAAREALTMRNQLLPHRYSLAKHAYDTGLGPNRPMYYDYPQEAAAYDARHQFLIGSDLLVAPIYSPVSAPSNTSSISVWLPPGSSWFDIMTSEMLSGAQNVTRNYSISQIPLFVRAGAVIATLPQELAVQHGVANLSYAALEFLVFPGGTTGNTTVYEDDGMSLDYVSGRYSTTQFEYAVGSSGTTFTVASARGTFAGQITERPFAIAVLGADKPSSVDLNGTPLPEDGTDAPGSWHYDSATSVLSISVTTVSVFSQQTVLVS